MKFQAPISPKGDANRYCGPAVISAVTGLTTGGAARLIRGINGNKCVMGTYPHELRKALDRCGIITSVVSECSPSDAPTFAQWVKQSRDSGTYIICVGNHWAAIRGRRYVCGIAKDVVPFDHPAVKRRARVTLVLRLIEKQSGLVRPMVADKPKPKPVDPARRAFTAYAREHNIDWELPYPSCDVPIVWGVRDVELDAVDPWEGDHEARDWDDALSRAKEYVRLTDLEYA